MLGVNADAYGAPRRVNEACGGVTESQVLEGWKPGGFGQGLSVIRNSPGYRVPNNHDELSVATHGEDATRGFFGDEVTGGLLHGDLTLQCTRHQVSVPLQPFVVEAVEEVRLCAHGSHIRMDAQELQQSPSATFLHPDDDGLRELFTAEIISYRYVI